MKTKTIPLTERQVGWILFCFFMNLLEVFFIFTYYTMSKTGHEILIGIIVFINTVFILFAFVIDGRYDTNPAHWIGYCLRLKSSDKPND